MNHPLARALHGAGLRPADVATTLGVDPKTVHRWLAGRMPYPRYQAALAALTGWARHDLWPQTRRPEPRDEITDELRAIYPQRAAVPLDAWYGLIQQAKHAIDILAYAALPLAQNASIIRALKDKAHSGVSVRLLLGDPEGVHVARRGAEERVNGMMSAHIRTALIQFKPLVDEAGAQLRLHDTVLYNSIYRVDSDLLINTHILGVPASYAPVLHLRRRHDDGAAATYLASFVEVWIGSRPWIGRGNHCAAPDLRPDGG